MRPPCHAARRCRGASRLAKVFWFFFSKKNERKKSFFLKKEAKTFLCWARASRPAPASTG
jgi:hypothetical protein